MRRRPTLGLCSSKSQRECQLAHGVASRIRDAPAGAMGVRQNPWQSNGEAARTWGRKRAGGHPLPGRMLSSPPPAACSTSRTGST